MSWVWASIACPAGPPRSESSTGTVTRVATKATGPSMCRLIRLQVASMYRMASSIQILTRNESASGEILSINGDNVLGSRAKGALVDFRRSIRIITSLCAARRPPTRCSGVPPRRASARSRATPASYSPRGTAGSLRRAPRLPGPCPMGHLDQHPVSRRSVARYPSRDRMHIQCKTNANPMHTPNAHPKKTTTMEPRTTAALHLTLTDHNDPEDVIDVMFLEAFVAGSLRRARSANLPRVRAQASMLPPGVRPIRVATSDQVRALLARGDGWVLRARRWQDGSGDISVLARSAALADRVLADASRGASEPVSIDPHRVPVGFWHLSPRGPSRSVRTVAVEPWPEIRRNYTRTTAEAGDRLMVQRPEALGGRLLLLHGPPGTGKTTMLPRPGDRLAPLVPRRLRARPRAALQGADVPAPARSGWNRGGGLDRTWRPATQGVVAVARPGGLRRAHSARRQAHHRAGVGALAQRHRRPARPGTAAPRRHHDERAAGKAPSGGHPSGPLPGPDRGRSSDPCRGPPLAGPRPRCPRTRRGATEVPPWPSSLPWRRAAQRDHVKIGPAVGRAIPVGTARPQSSSTSGGDNSPLSCRHPVGGTGDERERGEPAWRCESSARGSDGPGRCR